MDIRFLTGVGLFLVVYTFALALLLSCPCKAPLISLQVSDLTTHLPN